LAGCCYKSKSKYDEFVKCNIAQKNYSPLSHQLQAYSIALNFVPDIGLNGTLSTSAALVCWL